MSNNDIYQPSFFSDAELELNDLYTQGGPVRCLGMEFDNDEIRREYFRNELRQRLPELRKIEGFPIGTDDDIIRLSDPPYHTACPNPWLNDFIREWEDEKVELEREGKRDKRFRVSEPYASDVSDIKNDSVYRAHMYHTKVPHKLIMRYLLHYTEPGDIVLDGFAGTGMTGVAAQACGDLENQDWETIEADIDVKKRKRGLRHAICGDLSPYAATIAYNYNTPASSSLIKSEMERIYTELQDEIGWMFETKEDNGALGTLNCVVWSDVVTCPSCGQEYVLWNQMIDYENKKIIDGIVCPHCSASHKKNEIKPVLSTAYDEVLGKTLKRVKTVPVIVVTTVNGRRIQRKPNQFDLDVIQRIENTKIEDWCPSYALPDGYNTEQPKKTKEIYHVHQFYTKRNLITMSKLYAKINNSSIDNKLRFVFTGMINRSTIMNKVHFTKYLNGKSDWDAGYLKGTLYIPPFRVESSSMAQIGNKLNRYLKAIPMLTKQYSNALYIGSANHIQLGDNSIDYIFTDPPFGANINYSELNTLPEAWLGVITNNVQEAIENNAQGKSALFYRNMMTSCFKEYCRILKPNKWMTVEFSNTSASVWNSIQNALQSAGFIIANVSALNKGQGGIRSVTTTTAVKQDLVITCYKPSERLVSKLENATDKRMEANDFVEELLQHLPIHIERNQKTTAVVERSPNILYDRLISYYVQHGWPIPMDAGEFQQMLRNSFIERDGMFFTASQALQYEEKRAHTTEFVSLALIVASEAEGIAWLNRQLEEKPQTYQELQPEWMMALSTPKKGDRMPELMDILEENFIKQDDGTWRKPDAERAADLETMRQKKMAKEFALYAEQAAKPKAKRMKDCRLEVLRYGFKDCYKRKDYATIVSVGDHIQESLLLEDEVLLQYYDNAVERSGME